MDKKERLQLAKDLARDLKPHTKARNNFLNNQLLTYLSGNAPIHIDDTPHAYIQEGYEYNPDVYSVVNGITNAASSVPPVVHRVVDEAKARKYYRMKHARRENANVGKMGQTEKLKEEAFEEVDRDDDLYRLIQRPNPLQAWPEFFENILGFKLITGNSYTHGVELTDGRFSELWPMPPQLTRIKADKNYETVIKAYTIDIYGFNQNIPADTVMHLKYWNPNYKYPGSHLYGMSPLKAARRSVRSGNDGQTALSRAYSNMGASGMLFPKSDNIQSLSKEQQRQIKQYFNQHGAGPRNYKDVLAFSVEMGWQQFGMSPVDLEILEAKKYSQRDICNVYNYPSGLLNDPDDSKAQSNQKENRRYLYTTNVIPALERTYEEINRFLTRPYVDENGNKQPPRFGDENNQYHIDYDVSGIEALSEDMEKKVSALERAWWLTPNERRKHMPEEALEDPVYDRIWAPMNIGPITGNSFTEEDIKRLEAEYGK